MHSNQCPARSYDPEHWHDCPRPSAPPSCTRHPPKARWQPSHSPTPPLSFRACSPSLISSSPALLGLILATKIHVHCVQCASLTNSILDVSRHLFFLTHTPIAFAHRCIASFSLARTFRSLRTLDSFSLRKTPRSPPINPALGKWFSVCCSHIPLHPAARKYQHGQASLSISRHPIAFRIVYVHPSTSVLRSPDATAARLFSR